MSMNMNLKVIAEDHNRRDCDFYLSQSSSRFGMVLFGLPWDLSDTKDFECSRICLPGVICPPALQGAPTW
jgi:hypothetical protein